MVLSTGWDFDKAENRRRAVEKIRADKPALVIGSPPCTVFSQLQRLNLSMQSQKWKDQYDIRRQQAIRHVEFCVKLYKLQISEGRYFLHEHPDSATSWKLPGVEELTKKEGVWVVRSDLCMYGLTTRRKEEEGPARKPTRFATNSWCLAEA